MPLNALRALLIAALCHSLPTRCERVPMAEILMRMKNNSHADEK